MAARLSLDERVFIESSLGAGRSVADAAQRLGRDRSTVHRELARCAGRAGYDARWAHASACARARRERTPKLAADRVLAAAVDERLKLRWSPHATAADLREAGMRVCAETIYRACYANDARSGLPAGHLGEAAAALPAPSAAQRRAGPKAQPAGGIPADSRPARRRRGPYRARPLGRRPHRRQSEPHRRGHPRRAHQPLHGHRSAARRLRRAGQVAAAVTAALGRQPAALVRSLTWDQGREMARWADVEAALGIEVFFCEPRSPWQRPTNEQTNGLLRRWLPKGTSLDIGQLRLSVIEDNLNHMPRRLHHWTSAHDIYTQLTCNTHNGWALSAGEGLTRVATGPSWCPAVDLSALSGRRGAHRPARRM